MLGSVNLRSALFDNVQTRPRVIAPYYLNDGRGISSFRIPLERSIKPLPTLPHIVGNRTYDPMRFEKPYETPGTTFIRNKMLLGRTLLPTLSGALGEPSKTNPTVL